MNSKVLNLVLRRSASYALGLIIAYLVISMIEYPQEFINGFLGK